MFKVEASDDDSPNNMDHRMIAQQNNYAFPFYPLFPAGNNGTPKVDALVMGSGANAVTPPPPPSFVRGQAASDVMNAPFAPSSFSVMNNQQRASTPPWLNFNTYQAPQTQLMAANTSPHVNTALQTVLLLARLHEQSTQQVPIHRQQQPNHQMMMKSFLTAPEKFSSVKPPTSMLTSHGSSNSLGSSQSRKRPQADEESRASKNNRGGSTDSDDSGSEREISKSNGLRGERRLVISFESLGSRGQHPQPFGKSGALIPDGVSGSHTVYNERWRFEITHGKDVFTVERMKCVCLTWKVTNLTSGHTTAVTETRDEAVIRNSQGQTITNRVFREALEARAKDLESGLVGESNFKKITQTQALIRSLRPKRFSEGPLVFGLQHKIIQDRMLQETA